MISDLLIYPFENNIFSADNAPTLLLGANYSDVFKKFSNLDVIQNNFARADKFEQKGFNVQQNIDDTKQYDLILYAVPQQKIEAQYMLACLSKILSPNGQLVAAAMNDAGGKRLPKWFKEIGFDCESLSKSKGRVVWSTSGELDQQKVEEWIVVGQAQDIDLDDLSFKTKPGIYGWNKIDTGSRLLIDSLSDELSGIGADYGCGYGYLSHQILNQYPNIQKLYAMDADYNSLDCARYNLSTFDQIEYCWCDLTKPQHELEQLDFIIMNPPFHDGKLTASSIGVDFIKMACNQLKKDKKLYIVANNHLPYEKVLAEFFTNVQKIDEKSGFKVFCAVK